MSGKTTPTARDLRMLRFEVISDKEKNNKPLCAGNYKEVLGYLKHHELDGLAVMAVDVSVPRGKLQAAVQEIRQIGENFGLYVLIFGHLGDGNLHVNVMYDSGKNSESLFAGKLIEKVLYKVLGLGGSISGEHGVGLVKKPYLNQQLGRKQRNLMQGIKRVFDPENIMNPDKAY